jgi:hypothetical protein
MSSQWENFCATLQKMGNELLRAAPDEQTRAEGEAYLARLAAGGIQRFLSGPERLTNGIDFNQTRIGGFNPDYRLGTANVQGDRHYRLRGRINQAYRIGLGLYSQSPDGSLSLDDYKVLMAGKPGLGADGSFNIEIGPDKAKVDLRLRPTTNLFIVRELLLERGGQRADMSLDGESPLRAHGPISSEQIARSLTAAQYFFTGSMTQFLEWTNGFAAQENAIAPLRPEFDNKIRGDPGTAYYTGYFNLREDQALIVEIPAMSCDYWGIMLANHWQEPLSASFLNHVTAKTNSDGAARIIIAPRDPGEANWLSTDGRSRGVIWHRRINADVGEAPRCTLRERR